MNLRRLTRAARSGAWLDADRARAYLRLVAGAMLILVAGVVLTVWRSTLTDPLGRPAIGDFCGFWAAAHLALAGQAAAAYTETGIRAAEALAAQPAGAAYLPYIYPPVFTLCTLPFALVGYLPAYALFALGGAATCAVCLRAILPRGFPALAILAFPGLVATAVIGQNGCIGATAFAGALLLLDRAPLLGGVCLGALAYKPQLALAVPVALLAARRWRALAACAATATALVLLSWAAFGTGAWRAFLADATLLRTLLLSPSVTPRLLSLFAALRLLGVPAALAGVAQLAAAAAALAGLAAICARRPGAGPEVAALVAAGFLCTPYLWDYDLVCLGVPLAWLTARATATFWRPWEITLCAALYVLPVVARNLNLQAGLCVTPFLLACLLVLTGRRAAMPDAALP